MAQSSFPFENVDTTETQFSQMFRTLNAGVNGTPSGTELKVTAGTGLQVSVALGQAMVRGHFYNSTAAELLTISTANATNPRIDTVVLRLDPVANSIVLAVVAGTAAASPVAPTLTQTDAGVYEFPLANVAVAAGAGTVGTITDRRTFMGARLQKTAGAASRDLLFPSPKQGDVVWRDDIGALETYYDLASIGNPGGRDVSGWYVNDRQTGPVPIKPPVVTVGSGSAVVSAIGKVSFTNATSITLDNIFSSQYENYEIIVYLKASTTAAFGLRYRYGATPATDDTANYYWSELGQNGASVTGGKAIGYTYAKVVSSGVGPSVSISRSTIYSPNIATETWTSSEGAYGLDTLIMNKTVSRVALNTQYNGIYLFPTAGSVTGTVLVQGFNS